MSTTGLGGARWSLAAAGTTYAGSQTKVFERLRHRLRGFRGQTMTEYVMIFTAVAILAFAAYKTLGNDVSSYITTVAGFIKGA